MDETTPNPSAPQASSDRRLLGDVATSATDGSRGIPQADPSSTQDGSSQPNRSATLFSTVPIDDTDVGHVLRMLRHHKGVVLGTTVFLVVLAVLMSLLGGAQYEATAEVLLRRPSAVASGVDDATDPERAIQNEIRLIESDVTRNLVAGRLGREVSVDVSASEGADLLSFTARDDDPDRAAAAANAYAEAYLEVRSDELSADADALGRQIGGIDQRLAELPRPSADDSPLTLDPAITEERARLADQRAALQSALLAVEARLAGAGDRPRLVTPAEAPTEAPSARLLRNVLVALVLGFLLGCLLAAMVDLLRRRIHDERDAERASGLATLATVKVARRRGARHPTTASESYRALRAWLFPSSGKGWPQVVAVVPVAGDGAAAEIVAGLGRACASEGRRVLLVAGDLSGSHLHRVLGVSNEVGLASVLGAGVPLSETVQLVPGHQNLSVVAAGPPLDEDPFAARPAIDLVERLRDWVEARRTTRRPSQRSKSKATGRPGGVVLLELPPVVAGGDGLSFAAVADATVLVVSVGARFDAVRRTASDLERCGAALRGTVLVKDGTRRRQRPAPTPTATAISERPTPPSTPETARPTRSANETSQTQKAGQGEATFKSVTR